VEAPLVERRGIEMGHVFRLGLTYTQPFGVTVLDESGEQVMPTMGCYGIGVERILAAAVEAHHDEAGIMWPASIAPHDVHIVGLSLGRDEAVAADAEALYTELQDAGLDVIFDDRDESPGVKFNDADLIGVPLRATVSTRNLRDGVVEVQARGDEASKVARADAVTHLTSMRAGLLEALTPER
jgi:prolyl-tRNA synthetase